MKQQVETTQTVTQVATYTVIGTIIPLAIMGNLAMVINTIGKILIIYLLKLSYNLKKKFIDQLQLVFYLLYVNLDHPSNTIAFFDAFHNFQLPFIPSLFSPFMFQEAHQLESSPFKYKILKMTPFFMENTGQSFTIILGTILTYLFFKIFFVLAEKYRYKYPKLKPIYDWLYYKIKV